MYEPSPTALLLYSMSAVFATSRSYLSYGIVNTYESICFAKYQHQFSVQLGCESVPTYPIIMVSVTVVLPKILFKSKVNGLPASWSVSQSQKLSSEFTCVSSVGGVGVGGLLKNMENEPMLLVH